MVISPSDQIIRHHFLNQFDLNKDLYQSQMDRIPFTQLHVVTNGEKFNVNIGVKERLTAGPKNTYKWNKLFDSMFMIFNEFGCIKAYGLTKDVCIDQIIQCLVALAPFNPETETISMSNYCCVSRDSILEAFPNASVVFDLDYAKNLLKEMINCNDDKHEIYKDLDSVFKTNLVTENANQLQMISNLNTFYSKWSKEENGALLNESFIDVMDNILLHVRNGCVPTKGQELVKEKTKKIFDLLSKVFQPLFLGVQSACAMVAHMVYVYNCQKLGNMKYQPIWSHQQHETVELVEFPKGIESEQELATETIENAFQSEATQEIPETKESQDSEENQTQEINQEVTADVGVTKAINVEEPPPEELVQSIDLQNFCWKRRKTLDLANHFKEYKVESKLNDDVSLNGSYAVKGLTALPLDVWKTNEYLECNKNASGVENESFPIQNLLIGLNLTEINHTGTFLSTFPYHLMDLFNNEELQQSYKDFLSTLNITGQLTYSQIVTTLIQIVCNELNKNSIKYAGCIQTSPLNIDQVDLCHILQSTVNALNVMIILIPSRIGLPFLPIVPSEGTVNHKFYLWCGPKEEEFTCLVSLKSMKIATACRCGRRDKVKDLEHCEYNDKCSCYKRSVKCNRGCFCKNCLNGRPVIEKSKRRKRMSMAAKSECNEMSNPLSIEQSLLLESLLFLLLQGAGVNFLDVCQEVISKQLLEEYSQVTESLSNDSSFESYIISDPKEMIGKWVNYRVYWSEFEKTKKQNLVMPNN
eukprot:TCONS_00027637-protein